MTVFDGTVDGRERRGRNRMKFVDNIKRGGYKKQGNRHGALTFGDKSGIQDLAVSRES